MSRRTRPLLLIAPFALCMLALLVVQEAAAGAKDLVTFQCRLVQDGTPLSGSHTLVFQIWDDATATDEALHLKWKEEHALTIANGVVSVRLGENGVSPDFDSVDFITDVWANGSADRYVMVQLLDGGGATNLLAERIRITAVPYSVSADNAERADALSNGPGQPLTIAELDQRYLKPAVSGGDSVVTGTTATLILEANPLGTTGTIVLRDDLQVLNSVTFSETVTFAKGATVGEGLSIQEDLDIAGHLVLTDQTTPVSLGSDQTAVYPKADGKLYFKRSSGPETEVGSGSAGGAPCYTTNGFRLTAHAGVAVVSTQVIEAPTVFLTPYVSNEIWTKDSGTWTRHTADSDLRLDLAAQGTQKDTNYDVFVHWDGQKLVLSLSAWFGPRDRMNPAETAGTSLTRVEGVWVKEQIGGVVQPGYRYVGTFRTTDVDTQTEDSEERRFVWNVVNRVSRSLRVVSNGWTPQHTSYTWHPAADTLSSSVEFVCGLEGQVIQAYAGSTVVTSSSGSAHLGLALDRSYSGSLEPDGTNQTGIVGAYSSPYGESVATVYQGVPGVGSHRLVALYKVANLGSAYFYPCTMIVQIAN